jgi:hypothetical protein
VGPEGTVALVTGAAVAPMAGGDPAKWVLLVSMLAIMTGVMFLVARVAKIGWMADYLSQAVLVGYIAGVAMTFALFIAGEDFVLMAAPGFLAPLLSGVGLGAHYWSIGRGVIDSRDLLYFAAVTFFFLYLTVRRLQGRRG